MQVVNAVVEDPGPASGTDPILMLAPGVKAGDVVSSVVDTNTFASRTADWAAVCPLDGWLVYRAAGNRPGEKHLITLLRE